MNQLPEEAKGARKKALDLLHRLSDRSDEVLRAKEELDNAQRRFNTMVNEHANVLFELTSLINRCMPPLDSDEGK